MNKLIHALLTALAICTFSAQAGENITIIYAWQASDAAANYVRNLVNEANKLQRRYTFLFDVKPGAGGSIAANYVQNTPNTILSTTSSFFIRPQFYPNESHNISNFRELMPQCDAPVGIYSKKYQSWQQVPTNQPLTISITGLGITTHLVATKVAKKYTQLQIIPYKGSTESTSSVLSGTTDLSVSFIGDSDQYVHATDPAKRLYLLGVSGNRPVDGVATLASQGFATELDQMSVPAHLVVPVGFSEIKFKEIRTILMRAAQAQSVVSAYYNDRCVPINQMSDSEIDPWFHAQLARWKKATIGVDLK